MAAISKGTLENGAFLERTKLPWYDLGNCISIIPDFQQVFQEEINSFFAKGRKI